jgi:hypothetical protein
MYEIFKVLLQWILSMRFAMIKALTINLLTYLNGLLNDEGIIFFSFREEEPCEVMQ